MTDKELLHQLLRRNHQLTAKCEGLAKRLKMFEETRPPVEVLNASIAALEEMGDNIWFKTQALSLIIGWAVDQLDGDWNDLYEDAERVVIKERLQCQFEEPTTDAEDGHS